MNERRPASRTLVPTKPTRRLVTALASTVFVAAALAGCSSSGVATHGGRSGPGAIDPKLGVAASPRVVGFGEKVPKGGGRAMVGKPYKVAGKRYVPHLDPDYEKVGLASWYGNAFHGRRTANGEVFDSEHLSAAHPTMPLPSYARVTSIETGRSVVVRVNDRGPFHSNRLIDISRRTAEVLGVRSAGVAKVKVEYVGPAPVQGDDTAYLMATYRGPADIPSRLPETMVASAEQLPGVAARATTSVAGAAASLFSRSTDKAPPAPAEAPVVVAAAGVAPAPVGPRIPGTVLPPERPLMADEAYVVVAVVDPADVYLGGGTQVAALATPAAVVPVAYSVNGFTVGAQPISDPGAIPPLPPMRSSYAADRVSSAYAAVDGMGEGVALSDLTRRLEALSAERAAAPAAGPVLQVGMFSRPENAVRMIAALSGIGSVGVDTVEVNGRSLTRIRISALAVPAADAVAAAERAGAHGAHILR